MLEHHSAEEEQAQKRLLEQMLNRDRPHHSEGRLNEDDSGDLAFAIAADPVNKVVIINFGKPVRWVGFPKKTAELLVKSLQEKIAQLEVSETK